MLDTQIPIDEIFKMKPEVGSLDDFDMNYFHQIDGKDGWIAIGQENCQNQQYFTVKGKNLEKLGIAGTYDTEDGKNYAHIIVDPAYRGKGLASQFYQQLLEKMVWII